MTHNLDVQKRFIADAAHQMKTPLAGLRTQAELAQREADPVELQRSLRQIAASTERATRLVNQLLALARAEHGAGDRIARVPVDLDALARSVVQEWVAPALARGIDLGYEGPPFSGAGGGCIVHGTPVLLQELLTNLIDNALRYGVPAAAEADASAHARGRGRGRGQGVVTVRVEHDGAGKVRLDVEDDGPGIAAEERAHIFDRFYRVLGNRQDGSGLGLAIVREIALQHGAIVEVGDTHAPPEPGREAQGRGSRFRVTFGAAAA
jgi:two-component system sensor histidine kinase TctE